MLPSSCKEEEKRKEKLRDININSVKSNEVVIHLSIDHTYCTVCIVGRDHSLEMKKNLNVSFGGHPFLTDMRLQSRPSRMTRLEPSHSPLITVINDTNMLPYNIRVLTNRSCFSESGT